MIPMHFGNGRLLIVKLTTADAQDAAGAEQVITPIRRRRAWLKYLFPDDVYDRDKLDKYSCPLTVHCRDHTQAGRLASSQQVAEKLAAGWPVWLSPAEV